MRKTHKNDSKEAQLFDNALFRLCFCKVLSIVRIIFILISILIHFKQNARVRQKLSLTKIITVRSMASNYYTLYQNTPGSFE